MWPAVVEGALEPSGARRQETKDEDARKVTTLEAGVPLERELAEGQRHSYQLALAEGQYVSVVIKQLGVYVRVSLRQPDGETYNVIDLPQRTPEVTISRVAELAGVYQFDVFTTKAAAGRYEIRVVELRPATEGERTLQQARTLYREHMRLVREGRYEESVPIMARVLAMRERVLGPDHPDVVEALEYLASAYMLTGDYARAEPLELRALGIREKLFGPDSAGAVESLYDLGIFYFQKGDNLKAEETFGKVLGVLERVGQAESFTVAATLGYLGDIQRARGEYARAEEFYRRSLALKEKLFGPEHFHLSSSFTALGLAAFDAGDYARAEKMFARAVALREKALGPDSLAITNQRNYLAETYAAEGEYAKAEEQYRLALSAHELRQALSSPAVQETLLGLAQLSAARGNVAAAVRFQARACELEERYVGLNLAVGSERQKLAFLDTLSERADRTLSLNVQSAPDDPDATALAALTLLRRKGRLLDAMADTFKALRQRAGERDKALLDQLSAVTSQLARLVLDGPQAGSPDEHAKAVRALEERKEQLESEIGLRNAESRTQSQPVTLEAVRAAIPARAALVEFAVYRPFNPKAAGGGAFAEPRYAVYVMRGSGAPVGKDLGDAASLDAAVEALRRALRDPLRADVKRLARALDERVMRPVRALAGDAAQLLISPDGALNLIPFEALVDERGKYLIEHYSFAYLTSGRDLLRLQVARASRDEPVVVADPSFGAPAVSTLRGGDGRTATGTARIDYTQFFFGPLPGVSAEVRALRVLLPRATFLTGERATKAALMRVSGPSILHVATHGFFLKTEDGSAAERPERTKGATRIGRAAVRTENPLLRSGLALAGANRGPGAGDDGVLTAFEISHLDLWGTRLVVLSACDTGVGEVRNGDGVYGLRRAFVLAGAESQVMSLWPVSDRSTRDLMAGYYQRLTGGEGRGAALRESQLQLLHSEPRSHPYYWAGFIQTGEWANLKGER